MMKLVAVAFTAMVAFTTMPVNGGILPPFGNGPLYNDIVYFVDMIPMADMAEVILRYAAEDAEFRNLLRYFRTTEFKNMVREIEEIPEFQEFADYLQIHDVYVYDALNKLNKRIGIPPFHNVFATRRHVTGGLEGLFQEVKALISYDSFIHGYVHKMRTSEAFRDFVAQLKSPDHQQFVNKLYENVNYLEFRGMLVSKGIDVALIEDVIYTVLGIEFPVLEMSTSFYKDNQLSRDIRDFTDLVDMSKIVQIVLVYLDDDEVQRAMEYMYSEEFHVLVRQVEALDVYQDLVLYLEDAGLDAVGLIQKIHKLFGMEDYVPPKHNYNQFSTQTFANRGGIKGLVDEVIAVLPMDKFKALYREKIQNSPAFKNFVEKLRAPAFQNIVNAIYVSPIFLEMRQKAIDAGLNVEPVKMLIEKILGIRLPAVPMF